MIRIIAGEFRHREVINPNRKETRPTQDRVRSALFSALSTKVVSRVVLDLFAGSGAMGFEALSRGAKSVTLVDSSKDCIDCMKKTATNFKVSDKVKIIKSDAFNFLNDTHDKFDLVFLDPPYKSGLVNRAIETLTSLSLLSEDAIIVVEQDVDPIERDGFTLKSYSYGIKKIGIYRREKI